ncbi:MAG: aspartyl protease family protein [Gemmatimonadetes bacterium]|nr:aspartyl protease family protein [Gemmatimonadota bacterium]
MGHFHVRLEIGNPSDQRSEPVDAMVDTGSTYTWIPESTLQRLGIKPHEQQTFLLADGSRVEFGIADLRVRIGARSRTTIVVFGKPDSKPLLGVVTLEEFGLGVDPVHHRLVPVPGLA